MPILRLKGVPQKKYSLLCTLLFAGWEFSPRLSKEKKNQLVFFKKEGPVLFLDQKSIMLALPGIEPVKRPYSHLTQDPQRPGLILNISENLDAFNLLAPEQGLLPAVEVHRTSIFKPMQGLLRRFMKERERTPNTWDFIRFCQRHRKQHQLPGDTARLHRLIKLGNYNFWVLDEEITEKGKAIKVLPLKRRGDRGKV